MRTKAIALYREERRWLFGALIFVAFSSMAYMYFLCASVSHVVMRKELGKDISELSSNISELESTYILAQHAVSADIAYLRGYTLTDSKIFIDPAAPTVALGKNNDS